MGMLPHIVQYQGSKRKLASQIIRYMPQQFKRCIEPFCGTAAISIAVAAHKDVEQIWLNDINAPLINMIQSVIEHPDELYEKYSRVWNKQFEMDSVEYFFKIREQFNQGDQNPANMMYLLARCVKGSVRYNDKGEMNQSCDKRRYGTKPATVRKHILEGSHLLKGKTQCTSLDYREVFQHAKRGDIIYLDPPYQGTTDTRDKRYCSGVPFEEPVSALCLLQEKRVDFLLSYDGICGDKSYGQNLPATLACRKLLLNAGRSTQATLLGRKDITYEALYVSEGLQYCIERMPQQEVLWEDAV